MGKYAEQSRLLKATYARVKVGDAYSKWLKPNGEWKGTPAPMAVLKQIGEEIVQDAGIFGRIEVKIAQYLRARKHAS